MGRGRSPRRGARTIDELVQVAVNTDPAADNTFNPPSPRPLRRAGVLGITDADGVLVERYEYTPYGQRTVFTKSGPDDALTTAPLYHSQQLVTPTARHPYTLCDIGHQGLPHDREFDLLYIRNRYLRPATGRWTQPDQIGHYIDGMSLYEYVRSAPVGSFDPLGLSERSDIDADKLEYTCSCGWIDWSHATTGTTSQLIADVIAAKSGDIVRASMVQTAGGHLFSSGNTLGFIITKPPAGHAANTDAEEHSIRLALEMYMVLAHEFEQHQANVLGAKQLHDLNELLGTDLPTSFTSSYSEEDLVSDLIAFNRAAAKYGETGKEYTREEIRRKCSGFEDKATRMQVSKSVWDAMPGKKLQAGYKKWTPKYHTKDTCGKCNASQEKWPYKDLPWHPDNPDLFGGRKQYVRIPLPNGLDAVTGGAPALSPFYAELRQVTDVLFSPIVKKGNRHTFLEDEHGNPQWVDQPFVPVYPSSPHPTRE